MAERTVLILRVGQGMGGRSELDPVVLATEIGSAIVALKTQREDLRTLEQTGVHTAVWDVAGGATVDTDCSVLKDEGAALVDVTLHARLFVLEAVRHHARTGRHAGGRGVGSMGIVAIGALHEALIDAVFDGHGELRANVGVATVAEVSLRLGEELLGGGCLMDGVAVGANHVGSGVGTTTDVGAADLLGVAVEAGVEGLLGSVAGEGDDFGFVAFGFDVRLARAVAALAAFLFEFQLFVC